MPVTRLQRKAMADETKTLMDFLAEIKAGYDEIKAGQEEMKARLKAGYDEIKAGYEEMRAEIKAGYEEMKAGLEGKKCRREEINAGQEKVRDQLQQVKMELAEETGAIEEDAEMMDVTSEESEDEELKEVEVAGGVSEKDPEMIDGTSNGIKEKEQKHEEMKDRKKDFYSQVPEVEESESAIVKFVGTKSEIMKSQAESIEPSECSCDAKIEEADVQLTQSAPGLQENSPTSQTMCASYSADFADKDLILYLDTSACKESDSIHDPGANIGTGFQEIEENEHVPAAENTDVNCIQDANKLQSGERTVLDLPVDEKSERTESSDRDMRNRNTSENYSGKVFDPGIN